MKKMEKNYISEVIRYFFEKEYSNTTTKKVQQWLLEEKHETEKTEALYEVWENTGSQPNSEAKQALNLIKTKLDFPKSGKISLSYSHIYRIASIILLCILLTGGIHYLYLRNNTIEYNTANGELKKIDLPDGTKVWLNAGSSISYKTSSRQNKRIVKLSGEAYFGVTTDSVIPFIVETENLLIEVTGTEFNVDAYPGDSREIVTLKSGQVKVSTVTNSTRSDLYTLEPGKQFIYKSLSGIRIIQAHTDEAKSWINGHLIFPHTPFYDIINKLERHFNVKITINEFENSTDYYSVKFINGESLEQIMNVLKEIAGHFTYEIKD